MRIQHNISALRTLAHVNKKSNAMEKLASGYAINRAADNASGLGISEKMRAQIRGMAQAQQNVQDGVSLVQTADGALEEVHVMLHRMRELAVQASNGTYTVDERQAMQKEIDSLKSDVDRISQSTQFNGRKLLDGSLETPPGADPSKDVLIKAAYSANLDFTEVQDGTSLSVGGVTFEFDGDGTQLYSGSVLVDISTAVDVADIASQFKAIFEGSAVSSTYDASLATLPDGKLQFQLAAKSAVPGEEIKVEYSPIPDPVYDKENSVTEKNDEYILSFLIDLQYDSLRSGMTFQLDDKVFVFKEFPDPSNPLEVGIATNIDDCVNNMNQAMASQFLYGMDPSDPDGLTLRTMDAMSDGMNSIQISIFDNYPVGERIGTFKFNDPPLAKGVERLNESAQTGENSPAKSLGLQIGASEQEMFYLSIAGSSANQLGVEDLSVESIGLSNKAIDMVDKAVDAVSLNRAALGAAQNRLEHTLRSLGTGEENLTESESRIRDADMAKEMVRMTRDDILSQAAQAMLVQANNLPQGVLQLLK